MRNEITALHLQFCQKHLFVIIIVLRCASCTQTIKQLNTVGSLSDSEDPETKMESLVPFLCHSLVPESVIQVMGAIWGGIGLKPFSTMPNQLSATLLKIASIWVLSHSHCRQTKRALRVLPLDSYTLSTPASYGKISMSAACQQQLQPSINVYTGSIQPKDCCVVSCILAALTAQCTILVVTHVSLNKIEV